MKRQVFDTSIILNTSVWLNEIEEEIKKLKDVYLPKNYHIEIVSIFFSVLNEYLREGRMVAIEYATAIKEHLIAVVVADLEGGFINQDGLPVPCEFSTVETDIIVKIVCHLFDELLLSIDIDCLEPSTSFKFIRSIGNDLLLVYQSTSRRFCLPEGTQKVRVYQGNPLEENFELIPHRTWC